MEALLAIFGIFVGAFITLFIQWWDQKTRFRLVAIEKRLQTHQEAFALWYKLIWVIHSPSDEKNPVITEARNFWIGNCLYLEKHTRKEFDVVIELIYGYSYKLEQARSISDLKEKERIIQDYRRDWDRIFRLPKLIQSEVDLEPIVLDLKISAEG